MLALVLAVATQAGALHVRTSPAFAPCLAPAAEAFARESGHRATVEVAAPDPAAGADVVVGDDSEMTRLLEGGRAVLATSVYLGEDPWVRVGPEAAAASAGPVSVLGGPAGREARTLLAREGSAFEIANDPDVLRRAARALVPRSLAGAGSPRATALTPLRATAAEIAGSPNAAAARAFLVFLRTARAQPALAACFQAAAPEAAGMDVYGRAVVDWWLPQCSREHNGYNDPQQAIGPPDAANLGGQDRYRGLISLGQGGYVTLELGEAAADGAGPDLRVFQSTSNEPVTLYASASASGPFVLLGMRRTCGTRTPGVFSNHCDFDLRDGGLASARYVKVEDGEIYPCLAGDTLTEGADIDAVQTLNR